MSDIAASSPAVPPSAAGPKPVVVIEARPASAGGTLRSLWRYRSFYSLVFKEIIMRRARGTLLGIWWVFLRPLMTAGGYIFTFAVVAPLDTGHDVPYPVFFLAGFIPWRLFQATLTQLPRALIRTRSLMSRVYFPRLIVPLAGFGQALLEVAVLIIVFVIVVIMSSQSGPVPLRFGWEMLWVIPCLVGALMFALAFGMVVSIVALFFRDIIFSIGYIASMLMLVTPVLYPATFVPGTYRWVLFSLNPMAQVVTVMRWALTGRGDFEPMFVALAFVTITVAFVLGTAFFLRAEAHLGDQL